MGCKCKCHWSKRCKRSYKGIPIKDGHDGDRGFTGATTPSGLPSFGFQGAPREVDVNVVVNWIQEAHLRGSDAEGDSFQGASVSLSALGDRLAVGGPFDAGVGATWIFIRNGQSWTQHDGKLVGQPANGSQQGSSVSLSGLGNTLAVGGPQYNGFIGATWIFI